MKTDQTHSISITGLKQLGFFIGNTTRQVRIKSRIGKADITITTDVWDNNNWIGFKYGIKSDLSYQKLDYVMPLTTTPCYYGGKRYWFVCTCGRRCGILYFAGKYFVCRRCNNLIYRSQCQSRKWRILHKLADNIKTIEQYRLIKRVNYKGYPTKRVKEFWKAYLAVSLFSP